MSSAARFFVSGSSALVCLRLIRRTSSSGLFHGPVAHEDERPLVRYQLASGLPLYGSRLPTAALLLATADGHPRAISYTAWVPQTTIADIARHPFFAQLVRSQEGVPVGPKPSPAGSQISPAQLAAARQDLRHLRIGWALVWQTGQHAVIGYLTATGFRFSYRADGVAVYRLTGADRPAT
jgi:hypothetical protein